MSANKTLLLFYVIISCFHFISGDEIVTINNGEVVSSDSFKFVVGIQLNTLLYESHCTGGVIHKYFVLTAAHCLAKKKGRNPAGGHYFEYKKFKVFVYASTDSMKKISKNAIKRTVTDVYFVKQFFENGIDDIAILKLDLTLNNVLILPRSGNDYYNRIAVIAGYGDDPVGDKKNKKYQWSLKTMYTKTIDARLCQKIYPSMDIPVNADKQLCTLAIEHRKTDKVPSYPLGTCRGDSGAPILYQGNIVIGIVSRGLTICDSRVDPELPIRVSNYLDFIDVVINDKPIDPKKIAHYSIKSESLLNIKRQLVSIE